MVCRPTPTVLSLSPLLQSNKLRGGIKRRKIKMRPPTLIPGELFSIRQEVLTLQQGLGTASLTAPWLSPLSFWNLHFS